MGFGFNLFCVFILFPGSLILLLFGIFTKSRKYFKILGVIWLMVLALITISYGIQMLSNNKKIEIQAQIQESTPIEF